MENNNTIKNKTLKFTPAKTIILGFVGIILIGAALLCLPISHQNRQWFSFVDSLFTSTSAVCVTGLATADPGNTFNPFGRTILAILIQLGGLGLATISVGFFIFSGKKIGLNQRKLVKESLHHGSFKDILSFFSLSQENSGINCSGVTGVGSGISPAALAKIPISRGAVKCCCK
jgi:trk system potassium uptake protein TrkH